MPIDPTVFEDMAFVGATRPELVPAAGIVSLVEN